jgi:hypothetical protein
MIGQDGVSEVKPGFPQGFLDLQPAGRIAVQIDEAPKDTSTAVHMDSGRDLLNQKVRVQTGHQVLERQELMLVPHGESLGQFHSGVHVMAPAGGELWLALSAITCSLSWFCSAAE